MTVHLCVDERGQGDPAPFLCFEPKDSLAPFAKIEELTRKFYTDRFPWFKVKNVDIKVISQVHIYAKVSVTLETEVKKVEITDNITFIK